MKRARKSDISVQLGAHRRPKVNPREGTSGWRTQRNTAPAKSSCVNSVTGCPLSTQNRFWAGNRLFMPRKSGVITQPVYLGILPILTWAGPAEPGQLWNIFPPSASLLKPLWVRSRGPEKGYWGWGWRTAGLQDAVILFIPRWWFSGRTFPFLASGRVAYIKTTPK